MCHEFCTFFFSWDQTPPAKRLRNIENGKWEIFVLADLEAFIVATLQVVNQFYRLIKGKGPGISCHLLR